MTPKKTSLEWYTMKQHLRNTLDIFKEIVFHEWRDVLDPNRNNTVVVSPGSLRRPCIRTGVSVNLYLSQFSPSSVE